MAFMGQEERQVRRPTCKWEDNIKIHFKQTRWKNMNWTDLPQDRAKWQALVGTVMN